MPTNPLFVKPSLRNAEVKSCLEDRGENGPALAVVALKTVGEAHKKRLLVEGARGRCSCAPRGAHRQFKPPRQGTSTLTERMEGERGRGLPRGRYDEG